MCRDIVHCPRVGSGEWATSFRRLFSRFRSSVFLAAQRDEKHVRAYCSLPDIALCCADLRRRGLREVERMAGKTKKGGKKSTAKKGGKK
jgi:hypothetical protein